MKKVIRGSSGVRWEVGQKRWFEITDKLESLERAEVEVQCEMAAIRKQARDNVERKLNDKRTKNNEGSKRKY